MAWRFERDVTVNGNAYRKGNVVEDLPAGNVESMLSVGWITETDASPKQPSNKAVSPAPVKRRKRNTKAAE